MSRCPDSRPDIGKRGGHMGKYAGRVLGLLLFAAAIFCPGCGTLGDDLTFFPGYERTFGKTETEKTLKRFLAFAEQTDFSEWDYGVEYEVSEGAPEEISRKGMTGQVQAYRNRKQTVFQAEMSGGTFYYNRGEGILHCDTAEGTGPWDGQACVWEDFPFDAVNQRGNEMLHTLLVSGEFTDVVCEYVDAIDYDCKNMLRIYFWDHDKSGNPEWNGQTEDWTQHFGQAVPREIFVACNDDGTAWQSVVMRWDKPWGRCEVCWNSYDALLQSDRCVIRYEYRHGLRQDGVPSLEEQKEQLLREMGDHPYY